MWLVGLASSPSTRQVAGDFLSLSSVCVSHKIHNGGLGSSPETKTIYLQPPSSPPAANCLNVFAYVNLLFPLASQGQSKDLGVEIASSCVPS